MYYVIVNNGLIISENSKILKQTYGYFEELPRDYAKNKYLVNNGKLVLNPNYEVEQEAEEKERIAMLSLTAADVERAIYKAKGMDFEDIITLVEQSNNVDEQNVTNSSTIQPFNLSTPIDVKALKIELKANNFYRGNPYIEQIGTMLGFTSEMLDKFFETKDYRCLMEVVDNE